MNFLDLFDQDLLSSVLRSLIPILLAALGGMLAERVGIFNIGLEGMILIGAFCGVAASFFTHNWIVGVLVAMIAGALFSLILGYGSVYRKGDPIVLAIAMNILAVGMTSFLLRSSTCRVCSRIPASTASPSGASRSSPTSRCWARSSRSRRSAIWRCCSCPCSGSCSSARPSGCGCAVWASDRSRRPPWASTRSATSWAR
jgi:ABC-type uncharacterized transport system permease subunit